jgi:MFS family permease
VAVLFFAIFFCVYFAAYSFTGLGITLLTAHGLSLTASISLTLGSSVGGLIGAALAPAIADRWPRKYPAAITTTLLAADMIVLGLHPDNALFATGYFLLASVLLLFARDTTGVGLDQVITGGGPQGSVDGPLAQPAD